jgi:hypothetical protein
MKRTVLAPLVQFDLKDNPVNFLTIKVEVEKSFDFSRGLIYGAI